NRKREGNLSWRYNQTLAHRLNSPLDNSLSLNLFVGLLLVNSDKPYLLISFIVAYSLIVDNIPVMFAVLKMNPDMVKIEQKLYFPH
ncbi:MAG: hypothetical protein QGG87_04770, partial [Nitrospinota bacterium]|nr:hypothetical protein [Nitrospinota bacterium]